MESRLELRDAAPAAAQANPREATDRLRRSAGPLAANGGLRADANGGLSATARVRAIQAERERRERANAAMLVWGGAGAVVMAAGSGAVALREQIVTAWPETAGLYANLGMNVNLYGLEFADVMVSQEQEGGELVYVVRGAVTNLGVEDKSLPLLRFGLRDGNAAEIHAQFAELAGQTVPGGGRVAFAVRLSGPVERAAELEASFENRPMTAAIRAPDDALRPTAEAEPLELGPAQQVAPPTADAVAGVLDTPAGGLGGFGSDLRGAVDAQG